VKVWRPLEPLLEGWREAVVCAPGELALVPWGALLRRDSTTDCAGGARMVCEALAVSCEPCLRVLVAQLRHDAEGGGLGAALGRGGGGGGGARAAARAEVQRALVVDCCAAAANGPASDSAVGERMSGAAAAAGGSAADARTALAGLGAAVESLEGDVGGTVPGVAAAAARAGGGAGGGAAAAAWVHIEARLVAEGAEREWLAPPPPSLPY